MMQPLVKASAVQKDKGSVLIVENRDEFIQEMKTEISEAGYKVLNAKKFTEASIMMQKQKFNAIFINISIDGEFAHEYILKLRKNLMSLNRDTPIIVVGEQFAKEDFVKLGKSVSGAILAPFKNGALVENLERVKQ